MNPYFQNNYCTIYHGDCRDIIPTLGVQVADMVLADPPYGETSLRWDKRVNGWLSLAGESLKSSGSLWCFGSTRMFLELGMAEFCGWKFAQDVVWEKHNGSSFHADRFKRVHENALHFYRGEWAMIYKNPIKTFDATKRTVRRKQRPPHMGNIDGGQYVSMDGGPRLMRSVIAVRSCHGYAVHETQKPVGIVLPLVEYSCPVGGTVLDPMMGSGTTLEVCQSSGRYAIGIETIEKNCEEAAKRLRQQPLFRRQAS